MRLGEGLRATQFCTPFQKIRQSNCDGVIPARNRLTRDSGSVIETFVPTCTHRRKANRSDGRSTLARTHRKALPHSRSPGLDSLLRASDCGFREVPACRVGELAPCSLKSKCRAWGPPNATSQSDNPTLNRCRHVDTTVAARHAWARATLPIEEYDG
jgi:hypothetical protein